MDVLDKQSFLEEYKLQEIYKEDLISWDTINEIAYDYLFIRKEKMDAVRQNLEKLLKEELSDNFHSIGSRMKKTEHLAEKIIRKVCIEDSEKYRAIGVNNYYDIVRDLIGVRILVLAKEGWESVHNRLCGYFPYIDHRGKKSWYMPESPMAYIRYGDRDVFNHKINTDYTNKGYRSQHYIVYYQKFYCEIQVRTISEEVFGEFDHRVRYPYRSDNKFLMRYTNTVSQITSAVDELVSTCLQMEDDMWDECDKLFEADHYETFERRVVQNSMDQERTEELPEEADILANSKILRKGRNL